MNLRAFSFVVTLVAAALSISPTALQAEDVVVQEFVDGNGEGEYFVYNFSAYDLTAIVISTIGNDPATANPGWIAQSINQFNWDLPMGSIGITISQRDTWHEVMHMAWQEFNPLGQIASLNGYFLDYEVDPDGKIFYDLAAGGPISPNDILGGFEFHGPPDSMFLAAGVADASVPQSASEMQIFSGEAQFVPEPSSLALAVFGLAGLTVLGLRRRR